MCAWPFWVHDFSTKYIKMYKTVALCFAIFIVFCNEQMCFYIWNWFFFSFRNELYCLSVGPCRNNFNFKLHNEKSSTRPDVTLCTYHVCILTRFLVCALHSYAGWKCGSFYRAFALEIIRKCVRRGRSFLKNYLEIQKLQIQKERNFKTGTRT